MTPTPEMARPDWVKELPVEKAIKPDSWPPYNPLYYDWENWSTYQAYSDPERRDFKNPTNAKPDFSKARSRLDYSYHLNPAQTRQELQDTILSRVVNSSSSSSSSENGESEPASCRILSPSCTRTDRPWIVFTSGAMGVGKGYVLTSIYKSGLFPMDKFLIIDPDMLKNELPEMSGYLQADPASAATKVHRESTQMADVLLEHALLDRASILVDGSLRDVDYYKTLFQRIKSDYNYRIAIILVTAEPKVIHARASKRAEKTGRAVPDELINESIEQVPRSVKLLSPFADVVFEIANDDGVPLRIVSSSLPKENPSWDDFAETWTDETKKEKKKSCILKQKCCVSVGKSMSSCWDDSSAHDFAKKIWGKAYPNMCARCTLTGDGQCGVCVHGRHLCACEKCEQVCPVRKALSSIKMPAKCTLLGRASNKNH